MNYVYSVRSITVPMTCAGTVTGESIVKSILALPSASEDIDLARSNLLLLDEASRRVVGMLCCAEEPVGTLK